jgi:hypothetical protein
MGQPTPKQRRSFIWQLAAEAGIGIAWVAWAAVTSQPTWVAVLGAGAIAVGMIGTTLGFIRNPNPTPKRSWQWIQLPGGIAAIGALLLLYPAPRSTASVVWGTILLVIGVLWTIAWIANP